MLLVDWLVEGLEPCPWEVGCHSGPDTALEYRAGTALLTDLLGEDRSHASKSY